MSDPKLDPAETEQALDPVLHAPLTPGFIEYENNEGKPQTFYFQCNPTSLSRSRSIERVDSQATNNAAGTETPSGKAGRKYSHKTNAWKLDSMELFFDASMPHWVSIEKRNEGGGLAYVQRAIEHLEAISEPGPVRTERQSQLGAPPHPSPPLIKLTLGERRWRGHVSSMSIVEQDFTPDLVPRQIKVTLSLEVVVDKRQVERTLGGKL